MNKEELKEVKEKAPERFVVDIPPELWKRVKKYIDEKYLTKTSFTKQAFDHILTCEKESFRI